MNYNKKKENPSNKNLKSKILFKDDNKFKKTAKINSKTITNNNYSKRKSKS